MVIADLIKERDEYKARYESLARAVMLDQSHHEGFGDLQSQFELVATVLPDVCELLTEAKEQRLAQNRWSNLNQASFNVIAMFTPCM